MKRASILRAVVGLGAGAAVVAAYRLAFLPWSRRWGATDEEVARPLPGDEIISHPSMAVTRAITIEARPEKVWPWLLQIGYGRGGFYSFDRLERLLGMRGVASADQIIPELQAITVGDIIPFSPQGPNVPVVAIEPNRLLVLGGTDPVTGGGSWTFALEPAGAGRTRLVSRGRNWFPNWTLRAILLRRPSRTLPVDLAMRIFFEPGSFVLFRQTLLGIKRRAETLAAATAEAPAPVPDPAATARRRSRRARGA